MQHLSDSDTKRKRLWSKQWCIVFCALSFALSQNLRPHAPAAGVLFTPLCITRHTTEICNNTAKTMPQSKNAFKHDFSPPNGQRPSKHEVSPVATPERKYYFFTTFI